MSSFGGLKSFRVDRFERHLPQQFTLTSIHETTSLYRLPPLP